MPLSKEDPPTGGTKTIFDEMIKCGGYSQNRELIAKWEFFLEPLFPIISPALTRVELLLKPFWEFFKFPFLIATATYGGCIKGKVMFEVPFLGAQYQFLLFY